MPFLPTPKLGGSDAPHVWAARFSGLEMYTVHVLGVDGVWREYHVFASRAAAERSAIGFEAEGFRAKVYRTASQPIDEDLLRAPPGRTPKPTAASPERLGSKRLSPSAVQARLFGDD